jgi:hypothetical protein
MRSWARLWQQAASDLPRLRIGRRFRAPAAVALMTAGALVALAVPASAHIANPGSFTLTVTDGNVGLGLLQVPLPTGSMTGQIDSDGNISIPQNSLQVTGEPFSYDNTLTGFDVAVSGTATVQ